MARLHWDDIVADPSRAMLALHIKWSKTDQRVVVGDAAACAAGAGRHVMVPLSSGDFSWHALFFEWQRVTSLHGGVLLPSYKAKSWLWKRTLAKEGVSAILPTRIR